MAACSLHSRLAILLAAAAIGAGPARSDGSPVAPAAPLIGIPNGGAGTGFAKPAYGPEVNCFGITRQLAVLNPSIVVGEPLCMRLLLKADPAALKPEFMGTLVYGNDLKVFVIPPRPDPPYEYRGLNLGTMVPNTAIEFDGFNSYRVDFRMAFDAETPSGAAFYRPGEYRIRVQIACRSRTSEAQPMDFGEFPIVVREPQGDDLRALQQINDFKMFEFIHVSLATAAGRSKLTAAQAAKFERIAKEFPAAALRPHALFILADWHADNKRYAEARAMLQQVRTDYANTPFAETALFYGMRYCQVAGDRTGAEALFLEAWTDPTMTQLFYPKAATWEKYVKPFRKDAPGTQWMIWKEPGPDPQFPAQVPQIEFEGTPEFEAAMKAQMGQGLVP